MFDMTDLSGKTSIKIRQSHKSHARRIRTESYCFNKLFLTKKRKKPVQERIYLRRMFNSVGEESTNGTFLRTEVSRVIPLKHFYHKKSSRETVEGVCIETFTCRSFCTI